MRLCPWAVRRERPGDGAANRRSHRSGPGSALRRRPRGATDTGGGCGGPALRCRLRASPQRFHVDLVLRPVPCRQWPSDAQPQRAGDHFRVQQGPPPRSQATAVHPERDRRWRPGLISLRRRQHRRLADPHRHVEHTASGHGPTRLLVCGRLKTLFFRKHAIYPRRRRTLRHRDAALAPGGRTVPQVDPDPFAGLATGVGPSQRPPP